MTVDIICPLYQAENYIVSLHQSLLKQKNVKINKIQYILTNHILILKKGRLYEKY